MHSSIYFKILKTNQWIGLKLFKILWILYKDTLSNNIFWTWEYEYEMNKRIYGISESGDSDLVADVGHTMVRTYFGRPIGFGRSVISGPLSFHLDCRSNHCFQKPERTACRIQTISIAKRTSVEYELLLLLLLLCDY